LACLSIAACGGKARSGPGGFAIPVEIQVVKAVEIEDAAEYVASLKSRKSTTLQPQVEGQITRIDVRSGDAVKPGDAILEIDPAKQRASVRSFEANHASKLAALKFARDQEERARTLFAGGAASQQELEQAETNLSSAKAEVDAVEAQIREAQVELAYYSVVAPAAGIVGDIPVHVGDHVTTSTRLTTIDLSGALEAYVSVPIEHARQVREGLPVEILDASGKKLASSKITFVSPQVDEASQSILVKAEIPNPDRSFRESQFVRARVVWSTRKGPVVPTTAVFEQNGQRFAFVAEGQGENVVARQRPIVVGEISGNDYAIVKGISPGEKVIVSGIQKLADGAPVRPQP
jgi:RND family efflux transporter MFP subunit